MREWKAALGKAQDKVFRRTTRKKTVRLVIRLCINADKQTGHPSGTTRATSSEQTNYTQIVCVDG